MLLPRRSYPHHTWFRLKVEQLHSRQGSGFPSLPGLDTVGEVGSVQIMALLPRDHCLFGHPRAIIYNTMAWQRVSGFRWPRKAKFIFLEPWSGNVTPLSSTAPRSSQAQVQTPCPGEQALANSFSLIPRFSVSTLCSSEASCLSVSHPHTA